MPPSRSMGRSPRHLPTHCHCSSCRRLQSRRVSWYRHGLDIAIDVARALQFLHSRNIIHFDCKSPNILLRCVGRGRSGCWWHWVQPDAVAVAWQACRGRLGPCCGLDAGSSSCRCMPAPPHPAAPPTRPSWLTWAGPRCGQARAGGHASMGGQACQQHSRPSKALGTRRLEATAVLWNSRKWSPTLQPLLPCRFSTTRTSPAMAAPSTGRCVPGPAVGGRAWLGMPANAFPRSRRLECGCKLWSLTLVLT